MLRSIRGFNRFHSQLYRIAFFFSVPLFLSFFPYFSVSLSLSHQPPSNTICQQGRIICKIWHTYRFNFPPRCKGWRGIGELGDWTEGPRELKDLLPVGFKTPCTTTDIITWRYERRRQKLRERERLGPRADTRLLKPYLSDVRGISYLVEPGRSLSFLSVSSSSS